jgi:hypothetical protein
LTIQPPAPASDLPQIIVRNRTACAIVDELAAERSSRIWQYVTDALADTPTLTAEITRLRNFVAEERLDRANLAAAALAAISAYREGEPDPLSYLRDELTAQGHNLPLGRQA